MQVQTLTDFGTVDGHRYMLVAVVGEADGTLGADACAVRDAFLSPEQLSAGWEVGISGLDDTIGTEGFAVYLAVVYPPHSVDQIGAWSEGRG